MQTSLNSGRGLDFGQFSGARWNFSRVHQRCSNTKVQGCEERATLGLINQNIYPEGQESQASLQRRRASDPSRWNRPPIPFPFLLSLFKKPPGTSLHRTALHKVLRHRIRHHLAPPREQQMPILRPHETVRLILPEHRFPAFRKVQRNAPVRPQ